MLLAVTRILSVSGRGRPLNFHHQRRQVITMAAAPGAVSVIWFRVGDLRLADHEPLSAANTAEDTAIVPFFCLDSQMLLPSTAAAQEWALSLPATGPHRLAALLRAVNGLRDSLQGLGSDLICAAGCTATELGALATALAAAQPPPQSLTLRFYPSPTEQLDGGDSVAEEAEQSFLVAAAAAGVPAAVARGPAVHDTLYSPAAVALAAGEPLDDGNSLEAALRVLDFKPTMSEFRRAVQGGAPTPRRPLPAPSALPPLPAAAKDVQLSGNDVYEAGSRWRELYIAAGAGEALEQLEVTVGSFAPLIPAAFLEENSRKDVLGPDAAVECQRPAASESEALARLLELTAGGLAGYKDSRMMAGDGSKNSAMLSVALSLGTLSPRTVYWETLEAMLALESGREAATAAGGETAENWTWKDPAADSPGHHWLLMHLGIREYFIYWALAAGPTLLAPTAADATAWSPGPAELARWASGRTGFPFVDASMRELVQTGWMSNRGRQNTASFWSKGLGGSWQAGMAVFGALLVDHDPRLNLGNWAYVSGTGADPRDRIFRTVTQGERYDPEGQYVAAWVPEVSGLATELRQRPWEAAAVGESGGEEGEGYPPPMVDPATQIAKERGRRKK